MWIENGDSGTQEFASRFTPDCLEWGKPMARISRDCGQGALGAIVLAAAAIAFATPAETAPCEAGITLPKGFCATVFADKVGPARQMVVSRDGTLYVNTWSGAFDRT